MVPKEKVVFIPFAAVSNMFLYASSCGVALPLGTLMLNINWKFNLFSSLNALLIWDNCVVFILGHYINRISLYLSF